ncbi:hypothetical protein TWF694_000640 [Orbilia ellipsospora]|uniref:Nucleotide-diphospho-sugar transferase n=1 Tax=Orbilia ellipsospora TaxID=2528407 RepID=A0AAV9XSL0_9PEZI
MEQFLSSWSISVPKCITPFNINRFFQHHARIIIPSIFLGIIVGWMTLTSSGRGMLPKTRNYTPEHPYFHRHLHREKCAYVTLLATKTNLTDYEEFTYYFNGARVLAYQLLHAPDTRDDKEFIVLMPNDLIGKPDVARKVQTLRQEGVTVKFISPVDLPEEIVAQEFRPKYAKVFTKLRLWQLTEYDRLMYIDSDILLRKSLKSIWDLPETKTQKSVPWANQSTEGQYFDSEHFATLFGEDKIEDEEYVFAAGVDHKIEQHQPYMNTGFFVFRPSELIFDRLMKIMPYSDAYKGLVYGEQNLINYYFRKHGPFPWQAFPDRLHTLGGEHFDLQPPKVAVLHTKWWEMDGKKDAARFGYRILGRVEQMEIEKNGFVSSFEYRPHIESD